MRHRQEACPLFALDDHRSGRQLLADFDADEALTVVDLPATPASRRSLGLPPVRLEALTRHFAAAAAGSGSAFPPAAWAGAAAPQAARIAVMEPVASGSMVSGSCTAGGSTGHGQPDHRRRRRRRRPAAVATRPCDRCRQQRDLGCAAAALCGGQGGAFGGGRAYRGGSAPERRLVEPAAADEWAVPSRFFLRDVGCRPGPPVAGGRAGATAPHRAAEHICAGRRHCSDSDSRDCRRPSPPFSVARPLPWPEAVTFTRRHCAVEIETPLAVSTCPHPFARYHTSRYILIAGPCHPAMPACLSLPGSGISRARQEPLLCLIGLRPHSIHALATGGLR